MNTGQVVQTPHPILWIIGLVAAIVATVMATMIDSYVKGTDVRNHHGVQLFNECLAEQFGAYIVFLFAFATDTTFSKIWGKGILALSVLLAICFYIRGVRSTTRHDRILSHDPHTCRADCMQSLEFKTAWKLYGLNLIFAVLMFSVACYLAAISNTSPSQ